MKIGIFGLWGMNTPQKSFGGFETGFSEISPRLVKSGHDVTIYCRNAAYAQVDKPKVHNGVNLIYVWSGKSKNFSAIFSTLFAVLHGLLFRNYDIFFFVNVGMGFHCLLAKMFGKKVILNVNGLDWKRAKWGFFAKIYFKSAARIALKVCDELVTDAYAMQKYYEEEFNKQTSMIAYGAYILNSKNSEIIKRFGVSKNEYYLIASRLVPENNPDIIIKSFLKSGSKKKLLIAGAANYESDYHREILAFKNDNIIFTGHIDEQEVIRELHCNCFAYLHGHSVGGTNPALLKAMGYGNFILAYDSVFNREVLGEYGDFFSLDINEFAKKLKFYELNPDLCAEYRNNVQKRIESEYTWEKIASQYHELFLSNYKK